MIKPALSLIAIAFGAVTAHAADRMIRPDCWEENHAGVIERHCQVTRPGQPPTPASVPPQATNVPPPMPPEAEAPQPQLPDPLHRGYVSTLPRYYWPDVPQGIWAGPPPSPYLYPPAYPYAYPPPYYGPGIAFGFGPFSIVVT